LTSLHLAQPTKVGNKLGPCMVNGLQLRGNSCG